MTSSEPILRKATAADAQAFYGKPHPYTFIGYVAELDGEIIGIAGVFFDGGKRVAFSDLKPEVRKYRKFMVKTLKILAELFDSLGVPVYAVANQAEPTAPYLLIKLGFRPTGSFGPFGELMKRG